MVTMIEKLKNNLEASPAAAQKQYKKAPTTALYM